MLVPRRVVVSCIMCNIFCTSRKIHMELFQWRFFFAAVHFRVQLVDFWVRSR